MVPFDLHLKGRSSDEIGALSKNINIMSQKIKSTINDLNNFISNAIKHTIESGHIIITVKDYIIQIENEGSSLSDEQKERIWDTYVSSDREGTGLGLAINKSILDLHHFTYDVYNTQQGVCFEINCKDV